MTPLTIIAVVNVLSALQSASDTIPAPAVASALTVLALGVVAPGLSDAADRAADIVRPALGDALRTFPTTAWRSRHNPSDRKE